MNKIIGSLAVLLILCISFVAGWETNNLIAAGNMQKIQSSQNENPENDASSERYSPYDWIKEEQIKVYHDKIVVEVPNAKWAKFSDTNSMDPVFDKEANVLQIVPEKTSDIHLGDIISYNTEEGAVIHRVVEIGYDGDWYAVTKGDNNKNQDKERVRFKDISKVVVGIIY